jgi:hypothetical protein
VFLLVNIFAVLFDAEFRASLAADGSHRIAAAGLEAVYTALLPFLQSVLEEWIMTYNINIYERKTTNVTRKDARRFASSFSAISFYQVPFPQY